MLPAQRVRRGEFEVDGSKLDPGKVDIDTYVLSAVDDHIVPWVSGYKTTQLLGRPQPVRAQHLRPHRRHRQPAQPQGQALDQRADLPADPQEWKDGAELQDGTWWEDWATWIADQGGPMVAAPRELGSKEHPPIEAAPGSYVRTRA